MDSKLDFYIKVPPIDKEVSVNYSMEIYDVETYVTN